MELRKLTGGRLIGINQEKLNVSVRADPPKVRVGSPGTIIGNVVNYAQINECAKRQHARPEPTRIKLLFRALEGKLFLVIAPVFEDGPDVYEIKFERNTKALTVRGLKPLFSEAQVTLRSDMWYDLHTELAEDEQLGYVVAACWTDAQIRPRPNTVRSAAGQQPQA